MSDTLNGPPSDALVRLLSDEGMEFTPFSRALYGIDWSIASSHPCGSDHSIAEILGHMHFWQSRLLGIIHDGRARPVEHAADGWPAVDGVDWPRLVDSYLIGLEQLRALARDPRQLNRRLRREHENSVGYQIMSHFAHEAHHLGQIILLRRLQGAWPPAGGGDSW